MQILAGILSEQSSLAGLSPTRRDRDINFVGMREQPVNLGPPDGSGFYLSNHAS